MLKRKLAILCSALGAIITGVILCSSGITPTTALSYGIAPKMRSLSARAITGTIPALPSLPDVGWDATEEYPEDSAVKVFATPPIFGKADFTVTIPQAPSDAQAIVSKKYASSLSINNSSSKEIEMDDLLTHVPDIDLSKDAPQILIVHTHTTECYNETGQDWYTDQPTRTTDNRRNMVHMGEVLSQSLTERGYNVIHCQKRHDEDFNSSYDRSLETVKEYLKKYPSIAVVIDLHRDSLIDDKGTKYRPTITVNGEQVAQVMFLMGVGNNTYPHPDWMENLSLAAWIQREANETYPGLMRPILVRGLRYNQYLSNGALLVELGGCGNSPAEAERAAKLFGEVCAKALDAIREAKE